MNRELWQTILQFELDNPPGEYGFTTRLATENYWTKDFTTLAILEYKKFMYLAATSEQMVSPSAVVDVVWHQHLIFTQSYDEFCDLIGKKIQHIPATHNKADFDKFRQARERTKRYYQEEFGEQPTTVWDYDGMFESLNLVKSRFKLRTSIIVGILGFLLLIVPCFFLLQPLYARINNPYFIIGFICLAIATIVSLKIFTLSRLRNITRGFDSNSFICKLQPMELVYLNTQSLFNVVDGTVSQLVDDGTIIVHTDKTVELAKYGDTHSLEQLQIVNTLNEMGRTSYSFLSKRLVLKPVFSNMSGCMDAFKKYFTKSKKFADLFTFNFVVLATLLMLLLIRLLTGILRDKPVVFIILAVVAFTLLTFFYLYQLPSVICKQVIPDLYKDEIVTAKHKEENWEWTYFLSGPSALNVAFVPLVSMGNQDSTNYTDLSSDSSSGSSCGSSCGASSGCGGCGGGD